MLLSAILGSSATPEKVNNTRAPEEKAKINVDNRHTPILGRGEGFTTELAEIHTTPP